VTKKKYKGLNGYTDYVEKAPIIKGVSAGPARAPANIRMTSRFDYQPDICKDYKETGYCGYGDSCKFLHDRGDYKTGWQLEREWDEQQKKKIKELFIRGEAGEDEEKREKSSSEDNIPFACLICRQPFDKDPVVTKCGHYFDEKCALSHHLINPKCFVCNEQTLGIFNRAKKVIEKMEKNKKTNIE